MPKTFTNLALLLFLGAVSVSALADKATNKAFEKMMADEWRYQMNEYPTWATYVGFPGQNHRLPDMSQAAIDKRNEHNRTLMRTLKKMGKEKLNEANKLNYDLFLIEAEDMAERSTFLEHLMPINQLFGIHQELPNLINMTAKAKVADFEDRIKRMQAMPRFIDQNIALMKRGLDLKITPPKVTMAKVGSQIKMLASKEVASHPMYRPFKELPKDFSKKTRASLDQRAQDAILKKVVPAYEKLHQFYLKNYYPNLRQSISITGLANGKKWYQYKIKHHTTTKLTAEEIHKIGLDEVRRIRGEMDKVIKQSGFQGNFEKFAEFLRTDKQFYFTDKEDLLSGYRDIAKRADAASVGLFGKLPRLPYGIKAVPAYSEASQATAYYQGGSLKNGRAGYFYANTYQLDTRPKWEMEALTLHEAVPGHHLQIALAQEQGDLPEFRKNGGYTAYVEGWGLYAESLGERMGFYKDPYSKFGQLSYEIWRAIRLVVDTGLHSKGWSRKKAIDYFAKNTGKPRHDIAVEVDRYIVWPGQALAYKIGELKIKSLRDKARLALGKGFDIRAYHDEILLPGAVPLGILEERIDRWIAKQKKAVGH